MIFSFEAPPGSAAGAAPWHQRGWGIPYAYDLSMLLGRCKEDVDSSVRVYS